MTTFLKSDKSESSQKVAAFSGEGAYHGSSKPKKIDNPNPTFDEHIEVLPVSLISYLQQKSSVFESFKAHFPNNFEVKKWLKPPTQEEIKNDVVTFCWCPIQNAISEAGPLTKKILSVMADLLDGRKKYVYIDSKIQYFQMGDIPVDSKLWHIDGSIAVRDIRAQKLGHSLLHDMRARLTGPALPPQYMAYQSSSHCATQFVTKPLYIDLPDCITSFDLLDKKVQEAQPEFRPQPEASIVKFDGLSLHRAVPASADGWRLWIRCVETDREVKLDSSIINCYGTVFRPEERLT